MIKPHPDQYAEKHSITKELFIDTADDNYVAARWCYHNGLDVDFFWLAVHSLEKYLKAALLLNGLSSKKLGHEMRNFGHEIERLYAAVEPLAPELLDAPLRKPPQYEFDTWSSETVDEFVKRLYGEGQAHNRYHLFGHIKYMEDFFKFDQLVFAVRPLCQPLEVRFVGEEVTDSPNESVRQRMARGNENEVWHNLGANLEQAMDGRRGEGVRKALLDWNYPFAPPNYSHPPLRYSTSFQTPVLDRCILDPLKATPKTEDTDKLWQWVTDNIDLPNHLNSKIENERAKLKAAARKTHK